ncbi:uncharacterized protein BDZ99DRAFT_480400 [Mytilinidion resinicola]|uniref:Heterokaryon incompatibility domain-containing protein n=1 Tax=Mytilinidion resinicola TaxID=574789 RepID=A0A6A6YD08_9PEZI|nr:uncharacterized protein BDZ99DRAFT_480400 [Mytilinidion resinicola]KAF2805727.1 hypothetical protein BDZ99DRAFT_480400 [Mytilinidion resinicola]
MFREVQKSSKSRDSTGFNVLESALHYFDTQGEDPCPYPDRESAASFTFVAGLWGDEPVEDNIERHEREFTAYQQEYFSATRNNADTEDRSLKRLKRSRHAEDFILDASIACGSRKFFITSNGYYGLAPMIVQQGDMCCVLIGARVPFILRPTETPSHYQVVGECYVHGIMRGEVVQWWKEGKFKMEEISLV